MIFRLNNNIYLILLLSFKGHKLLAKEILRKFLQNS